MGSRYVLALAGLLVLLASGVASEQMGVTSETPPTTLPEATPELAEVEKRDLIDTFETDGNLTFGDSWGIHAATTGYISGLPDVGEVPQFNAPVFLIDDEPVFFMRGELPQYRDFKPGMSDGPDVLQLEEALSRMHGDRSNITVDEDYTSATQDGLERLYEYHGFEPPDEFPVGTILFTPDSFRIAEVKVDFGESVGGGAVFEVTDPNFKVAASVDPKQLQYFTEGTEARVELASGQEVRGVVTGEDRDVQGSFNSGNSSETDVSIQVEIELLDPVDDQYPEGAPVAVSVTKEEYTGLTVVPVTALVAVAGGGFAVDVWNGSTSDLVAVEIGPDVDGLVAITGEVRPGQQVVVP